MKLHLNYGINQLILLQIGTKSVIIKRGIMMKKTIFFIIMLLVLIIVIVTVGISNNKAKERERQSFNVQFENFSGKTMYGADVLTIINKAIDNNTEFDIKKDEEGFYIEDNEHSLKVELILLSKNNEGKIEEKTYQMEALEKVGLNGFISNFGLTSFECSNIEYNKLKRVSKITVKQLEI